MLDSRTTQRETPRTAKPPWFFSAYCAGGAVAAHHNTTQAGIQSAREETALRPEHNNRSPRNCDSLGRLITPARGRGSVGHTGSAKQFSAIRAVPKWRGCLIRNFPRYLLLCLSIKATKRFRHSARSVTALSAARIARFWSEALTADDAWLRKSDIRPRSSVFSVGSIMIVWVV